MLNIKLNKNWLRKQVKCNSFITKSFMLVQSSNKTVAEHRCVHVYIHVYNVDIKHKRLIWKPRN